MRTTLNLDDDLVRVARALARERGCSLGAVVSDLARAGLAPGDVSFDDAEDGLPAFVVSRDALPITSEMVSLALDE